jgi:hypothetical protein
MFLAFATSLLTFNSHLVCYSVVSCLDFRAIVDPYDNYQVLHKSKYHLNVSTANFHNILPRSLLMNRSQFFFFETLWLLLCSFYRSSLFYYTPTSCVPAHMHMYVHIRWMEIIYVCQRRTQLCASRGHRWRRPTFSGCRLLHCNAAAHRFSAAAAAIAAMRCVSIARQSALCSIRRRVVS